MVVRWPQAIREALSQLYEYRFFEVASPDSALVFLASAPVPEKWKRHLEQDRGVAVAWQDGDEFVLSTHARADLHLSA